MKKFLFVLLMLPMLAWAGEATVSWDPPLTYEDGTPLPSSDIQSYKVYISTSSAGPFTVAATVPGTILSTTISGLTKGTYYFVATTVSIDAVESAYSNMVTKTISAGKPKPPRNMR